MDKKQKLFWQIYPLYALVTIISLLAVALYASTSMTRFYMEHTEDDLRDRALLFETHILKYFEPLDEKSINLSCKQAGSRAKTRITVILPSGRVVGDSSEDPAQMDNHARRPEVIEAYAGRDGSSIRYSRTLEKNMMYVAAPVIKNGQVVMIVRTAISVSAIDEALFDIRTKIAAGGLVAAVLATLLSLLVSRRITRPIEQMKKWSEAIARGEFGFRPPEAQCVEIEALSMAMSKMGEDLKERINFITRQRNQIEAVLSSMTEGVIALDTSQRVISMNQAAGKMLGCDPQAARLRLIQEVVRNTDFNEFIALSMAGNEAVEKDIILSDKTERFFKARGAILRDADARQIGTLMVLNDVTQVIKLENMRRDFVANVSHEIKTPITAIKGFVETLLDTAIKDPDDTEKFLGIISRHADRLKAIVEDLLDLSRIEQAGSTGISLTQGFVKHAIETAIQVCESRALLQEVIIEMSCVNDLEAKFDSTLLEQAIMNLLGNAIKYSDKGSVVHVRAEQVGNEVLISVSDQGCGIAPDHLPRLFERFYRVDKARSRRFGGTGLGLAIVKHIMAALDGRVTVKSTINKGSVFTLHMQAC